MNFSLKLSGYKELTRARIDEYFEDMRAEGIPALLRESMYYSVKGGGKMLRPALVLFSCELTGGNPDEALPFAAAAELIHTYSLIHDDLPAMDDDELRRGRPTNHMVYGEGQAILAGDALLNFAYEIMLGTLSRDCELRFALAARALASGAGVGGMLAGQTLDLDFANNVSADEAMLLSIHGAKTGALITACVKAGAYCAGADERSLRALEDFSREYGLLFQITDDILDVEGDVEQLGKNTGKDKDKLTFPMLYGLDGAKQKAQLAAQAAKSALSIFGEKAWFFTELTDRTLTRKA